MTEDEILQDYLYLEKADFPAIYCLCFASRTATQGALRLLFDTKLSPKLVARLSDLFPGSAHVLETGLARFTSDEKIWDYAEANGFTIVTADADFLSLAATRGAPPKIVRFENCNYRWRAVLALAGRAGTPQGGCPGDRRYGRSETCPTATDQLYGRIADH